jgi:YVTN family beta-propeller protein
LKQFNIFFNYILSKKMISSKIIITSLMVISVITISNSINLLEDQIVYGQTVIDTLDVRNYPTAIEFNPVNGEIYVVNRGNDSISIINTDDRTNLRHINNISNNPFDLALDTSLGHLYIINEDLNPIIKVMNVSNKTIIDSKKIPNRPTDIIYDQNNRKIYFSTNETNGSIKVIDSDTREIDDFVKILGKSQELGFDSLNGNLYVLNMTSDSSNSTVTIINTSTKTIFDPIPIKVGSPTNFGFDSNHGHMYLTSANRPEALHVIDVKTRTIIDTLNRTSGLDFPLGMDLDKLSGNMYIANAGAHVFIIDTNDRSKYKNFLNHGEPVDIAFDTIHRHVYVLNKEYDSVTVIKPKPYVKTINGTINVGKEPERILYVPNNNLLYVSNSNGSIFVIDPITNNVKKDINLGTSAHPRGLDFVPYKNSIYVVVNAQIGPNKIYEIDAVTNNIVDAITVPVSTLQDIVFSSTNNYLYATAFGEDKVLVIDSSNNTVVTTIPVRTDPSGIEFVPSINKLFVTNSGNNSISVIDAKTNDVTNVIENVGNVPVEVILAPNNLLYVSLLVDHKVIAINPITNRIIATIPVGHSPWGMTFDSNNHLYVANSGNKSVSVIDTKTNILKHTIKNMGDRPLDIEFVPDKNMLYVVDFFGERVWFISTEFLQIRDIAEKDDAFGGSSSFRSTTLAAGDFNKDGYSDLAIGVPDEDIKSGEENIRNAGMINVIYGSASGLKSIDNQIWYQGHNGILDTSEPHDYFGSVLAVGDFNKDGYSDLAIGVPDEDIKIGKENIENAGMINVIYGSSLGLKAANNQIWYQGHNGILDTSEPHDYFGSALAAGNFGRDNADDLAIGVSSEDIMNKRNAGIINIIYGSNQPEGLKAANNEIWYQGHNGILETAEQDDGFGSALAAGDFNNTGFDDLAIGVFNENIVNKGTIGIINVIYGSITGLTSTGNQIWYQGHNGILETELGPNRGGGFGRTLAAGNFDKGSTDDLVIGAPTGINFGTINVIYGSPTGLTSTGNQIWYQGYNGIGDAPNQFEDDNLPEQFGSALAVGNFGKGNTDDLAIGVPGEDFKDFRLYPNPDAGMIHVIYGSPTGLTSTGSQIWRQDFDRFFDFTKWPNDRFGWALAAGDFNNTGFDDLAVDVPGEDQETTTEIATSIKVDIGVVKVSYGSSTGLNLNRNNIQLWSQDTS